MEVTLRPWMEKDAAALTELCNQIDRRFLSNAIPNPYTLKDAVWRLNVIHVREARNGLFRAICFQEKIIGSISIEILSDVRSKDAEIGYYLMKGYERQGIMTQAVQQMCQLAFENMGVTRITGLVFEPNIASRRVLEKNNFVLEGLLHRALIKEEKYYNLCVYGLLKES